jgi:hypothetical protein
MESTQSSSPTADQPRRRVLAVADWSLDPHAVVAAMGELNRQQHATFGLLVPARLHGLDWTGDPHASCPCARRQLLTLDELCRDTGISLETARVGDPESAPAIGETLLDWPAEQILLFGRDRRIQISHPFSLARRVQRRTGIRLVGVRVPAVAALTAARGRFRRAPRCTPLLTPTA